MSSTLAADEQTTLAFMTGISAGGTLIEQGSGWSWDASIADATVYDGSGWAHKWGGGAAGTPASVTWTLDAASDFTAGEQGIIAAALALWSAESGISFTETSDPLAAQLEFYRYGSPDDPGTSPGVYTSYTAPNGTAGATSIPATSSVFISLDTSVPYWSELDSFVDYGGYGVDSLVHEIGHALGLFHSGPYNGNVDPLTQQFNATDSRQWSIMSYIDPWQPAEYSAQYAYPDADWGASADDYAREPTTPMPLDILAAQRLYGMPADTPLSGGQVFGFHCTVALSLRPFFDFTVNTAPVITLWDAGTGNALDLSGFSLGASVDLRPGTFSSADGMTDNIGIAYGTSIDRVLGPAGGMTAIMNGDGDIVQGTGGVNGAFIPTADGLYAAGPTGTQSSTVVSASGVVDRLLDVQVFGLTGGGNTVVGAAAGTFELSGGGNMLFLGGRPATVGTGGADTIVAGGAAMQVNDTGEVGSLVFGGVAPIDVGAGGGVDTVVSGSGGGNVFGGAGGAFVWAAGPLGYDGGNGAATVAASASVCVTVHGGTGGGLFLGGGAGGNILVANIGAVTLVGGGSGDVLSAQNAANNVLVAGPGAETLNASGGSGWNVFFAGSGTDTITGGGGQSVFVAGAGEATVVAGNGPAMLDCFAGTAGGALTVTGWNPAVDRLDLAGYGADAVGTAIAGAALSDGSTMLTLADQTRITFIDVSGIAAKWFV